MPDKDCETLRYRADMLHAEAQEGVVEALRRGPDWNGFAAQVEIAAHCENLADAVDAKVEADC